MDHVISCWWRTKCHTATAWTDLSVCDHPLDSAGTESLQSSIKSQEKCLICHPYLLTYHITIRTHNGRTTSFSTLKLFLSVFWCALAFCSSVSPSERLWQLSFAPAITNVHLVQWLSLVSTQWPQRFTTVDRTLFLSTRTNLKDVCGHALKD